MNFKRFCQLKEAAKNPPEKSGLTHISHLEDFVVDNGKGGFERFTSDVRSVVDFLMNQQGDIKISEKIDGAPALFYGKDPNNGRFFVSTKSIFNVKPKINHTPAEVDENHGGVLATKLKAALKLFPLVYSGNKVYQSDLLFTKGEKKIKKIGGVKHITFKPNTIIYAIPEDGKSDLFKDISKAEIGAITHTVYDASIKEGGGIDIRQIDPSLSREIARNAEKVSKVFMGHPFHDGIDNASISKRASTKIENLLKNIKKSVGQINNKFDKDWVGSRVQSDLTIYLNSQLRREGISIFTANLEGKKLDFKKFAEGFQAFLREKNKNKKLKLKTQKARDENDEKLFQTIKDFEKNKKNFKAVMTAFFEMLTIKNILLSSFANIRSKIGKTFVQAGDEFRVTKPEGFVLVSGKGVVKMVDRLDFSKNNFLFGSFKK